MINKIKEKNSIDLKSHLIKAISDGKIKDFYEPFAPKTRNESEVAYLKRVFTTSVEYQFVKINLKNEIGYVAFHCPSSPVITRYGKFELHIAEVVGGQWGPHYVLVYPNLKEVIKKRDVLIRTDSGCHSGMVLGDITCDCAEQLRSAQRLCVSNGSGVIVHMPSHDGRGWGMYKFPNQRIMDDLEVDTVTAARFFYGNDSEIDRRTYEEAVQILRSMKLNGRHTFNLATNNPKKIKAFVGAGLRVSGTQSIVAERISCVALKNLKSKAKKWKHNFKNSGVDSGKG